MNEDIRNKLVETAKALVSPGKGILAADESLPTIEKRFKKIDLPSTHENRQTWRELLFTTKGVDEFISGVITFDETLRDGLTKHLEEQGIIPGIKVDQGTEPMDGSPNEKITKGLEGLADQLAEYVKMGAKFTKWRAVITIGEGLPTDANIAEHAKRLAEFARLSQEAGLVPIVEPEVLMDGEHDIAAAESATDRTLQMVFEELQKKSVFLPGVLLKPNFITSGLSAANRADAKKVAETTLKVLFKRVPKEVPGIVFLSGGQKFATLYLSEINKLSGQAWELSFSFGRELQGEPLQAWQGKSENRHSAQQKFYKRAKLVSLARSGKYTEDMENE